MWQVPESELQVLGDVAGKDVLELGCGAAQWAILLAQQGARMVGSTTPSAQLEHARERMAAAGVDFPLVHAAAESMPLPDASFDVVFCDHGALIVRRSAARRARGRAAFCGPAACSPSPITTPFAWICWNEEADRA